MVWKTIVGFTPDDVLSAPAASRRSATPSGISRTRHELSEQEALERLAAFSLVACSIDEVEVEWATAAERVLAEKMSGPRA
jgi:hypothetical protein